MPGAINLVSKLWLLAKNTECPKWTFRIFIFDGEREICRDEWTVHEQMKANLSHEKVYTREESMRFLKTVDKKLTFTEFEKVS